MKSRILVLALLLASAAISCKKDHAPDEADLRKSSFAYSGYNISKAEGTLVMREGYCDFTLAKPGAEPDQPRIQVIIHSFSGVGEYDVADTDIVVYASEGTEELYWKNFSPYEDRPVAAGKIKVIKCDERFVAEIDCTLTNISGDQARTVKQTALKARTDQRVVMQKVD
ncbi:hypothetical protein [Pedobacter sp. SYP-B3415]|uniref:hypothetical protein n=1 Tax=Pedobacter sp. SYP-B3415 TaxID=2496641 RepID=UPI00101BCB63|nr:hypothetical protein [Pedobacter sp. SYP-B3415]